MERKVSSGELQAVGSLILFELRVQSSAAGNGNHGRSQHSFRGGS